MTGTLSPLCSIKLLYLPDIYHLASSKDPLTRKILVYGIHAAELVQTILFAKKGFSQFAAGFGNFEALNHIGLLWFAVPIISSSGVSNVFSSSLFFS